LICARTAVSARALADPDVAGVRVLLLRGLGVRCVRGLGCGLVLGRVLGLRPPGVLGECGGVGVAGVVCLLA
jgi:hypothetical protein